MYIYMYIHKRKDLHRVVRKRIANIETVSRAKANPETKRKDKSEDSEGKQ